MRVLFVGVFDKDRRSTNTSQILELKRLGCDVAGYNYRLKAASIGTKRRGADLISKISTGEYDLVIFTKCNTISEQLFIETGKHAKTCFWFADALVNYDDEMRRKTQLVDYCCCDKQNVLEEALKINKRSFLVHEGYDSDVDVPREVEKVHDISFIGGVYGSRLSMLNGIHKSVKIFSNAYGADHAVAVCSSKINLNFCTTDGASDRVYKIMAAKGFLLTDDWPNRRKYFIDGKDCVIFNGLEDLNEKIDYYLANPDKAALIATAGYEAVKGFTRASWAKQIINIYDKIK